MEDIEVLTSRNPAQSDEHNFGRYIYQESKFVTSVNLAQTIQLLKEKDEQENGGQGEPEDDSQRRKFETVEE